MLSGDLNNIFYDFVFANILVYFFYFNIFSLNPIIFAFFEAIDSSYLSIYKVDLDI